MKDKPERLDGRHIGAGVERNGTRCIGVTMIFLRKFFDGAAPAGGAGGAPAGSGSATPGGVGGAAGGAPAGSGSATPGGVGGAAGGGTPAWHSTLSAELSSNPNITKYGSLEDFANGHLAAVKLIGARPQNQVALPDLSNPAAVREHLNQLGVPKAPSDYQLTAPTDAPQWLNPTGPMGKGFADAAHKHGMLPSQVEGMYSWFAQSMTEGAKQNQVNTDAKHTANLKALETEFGQAYKSKVSLARLAVDKLGGKPLADAISEAGLGTHPVLVKALAMIGANYAEASNAGRPGEDGNSGILSPAEAKAKGDQLTAEGLASKNPTDRRMKLERARTFYEISGGTANA